MADIYSKKKRSQVMAAIRSSGNKVTELKLASIFRSHGIKGWRRHKSMPGKPDFIFLRQRLAVFVDGCFWHGCRWHCRLPKSRCGYWTPKIARNKQRDLEIGKQLHRLGWRVCRIWEHSLSKPERVAARLHAMLGNASESRLNGANNVNTATHSTEVRAASRHAL
jgi:DNA mismatch endonuclease, patch repair protein